MNKTRFFGARMEQEVYNLIDKVAKEERLDKTSATKLLIQEGWKSLKIKKVLNNYKDGLISVDKCAKILNMTINEMMGLIAKNNINSEETLEEYKKGIKLLIGKN